MTKFFFLTFSLLVCSWNQQAFAEDFFLVEASARSQPQATNLVGTLAHDGLLWREQGKEKVPASPLFGYYRLGTRFGGSPSLAGFLQIAPIAPVVFEIQRGFTQRFSRPAGFDCDQVQCFGQIQRTDYSLRLAAAYENFILIESLLWRELETEANSQKIFIELENMLASPGVRRFFQNTSLLAYRLPEDRLLGFRLDSGILINESQNFNAAYLVYRQPWQEFQISFGAGQFRASNSNLDGFSLILSMSRKWGDSLSLF